MRWYLRYALSYRDLEEMMRERGLLIVHTTIYRWVQVYGPELNKRSRLHLKKSNNSWRVDETYIKVKGKWMFLYRAVDSDGQTLAFVRRSGGTVEMLRYPEEGHELSRSGKPSLRISRLTEMMNWFDRYCKPE